SIGAMIKWRGVEGISRYNYIGDGGQRLFDLVENQDGPAYATFEQYFDSGLYGDGDAAGANIIAAYQESAQKDFIYGNEFFGSSAWGQIHYAGDQDSDGMWNRNGILYFYSNTLDNAKVIFDNGFGGSGGDTYFQPRFDARNNILWARTKSWTGNIEMVFGKFSPVIMDATTNLMQSGTFTITPPILGAVWQDGTSEGWSNECDLICQWPLTVPLNTHLYGLTAANYLTSTIQPYDAITMVPPSGSAAIDAGTALTGKPLSYMPVRWQYSVTTSALTPRVDSLTIGAVDQTSGSVGIAATPIFAPGSGTYSSTQSVTITSATAGATIYYTIDGSTPTTSSAVYSGPITVSTSETIAAIAVATGYLNSAPGSATYVITLGQVATPTFNPPSGTYSAAQTVTISDATAGAT
ncbi:chitobiase/beta-hexosaminidase C-terminal domain-containing protein, partial [Telmatospirillum sp.]|uniref:chitobiase/beta-hexosaminidase C-terminal domain-containing protein n=1 Tax=Telmatospirillum sp. TaxID=2079197 RepID=UPI002845F7F0